MSSTSWSLSETAFDDITTDVDFNGQKITSVGIIEYADSQFSDYLVPGLALGKGSSAPTLKTFRDGIELNAFAGSGPTEEGFFAVHILHDIEAGSTPTFHVHWGHNTGAPTGDVKWQIEVTAAAGYEAGTFPATATLSTTQTAGAQHAHHITDDDDMPLPAALVASLEPDMVILGRVFRDSSDAADTFTNDAFCFYIDLHFLFGQSGTTERNRPFTSGGF
jgi:hypothetical protein